jgi:transcriptional regulator with XRE-family HTH domain
MTGPELAAWRKTHGYTQEALARALGVSMNTVARWEGGSRKIPSYLEMALESITRKGKI